MTSSPLAEARAAAEALLGGPVDALAPQRGGGNNRVYRVEARGARYALKGYPRDRDPRDRLGHEFGGLGFLRAHGVDAVPAAIAADRAAGFALYEWIEGTPVAEHGTADVAQALALLARLDALRDAPGAAALPEAAEACFRPADLDAQIAVRLERLEAVAPAEPALAAFLPELRDAWQALRLPDEPPAARRTLSPSDFGFHNALRRPDGRLIFIDFEYFGWDDPVKLVCDVLWHPGMALAPAERQAFAEGAGRIYGDDPGWTARVARDAPRYGLRWALIVLNEFLPAAWERRVAAGRPESWASAKTAQLDKARSIVARLSTVAGILVE